jgi:hypothetical protein
MLQTVSRDRPASLAGYGAGCLDVRLRGKGKRTDADGRCDGTDHTQPSTCKGEQRGMLEHFPTNQCGRAEMGSGPCCSSLTMRCIAHSSP